MSSGDRERDASPIPTVTANATELIEYDEYENEDAIDDLIRNAPDHLVDGSVTEIASDAASSNEHGTILPRLDEVVDTIAGMYSHSQPLYHVRLIDCHHLIPSAICIVSDGQIRARLP